MLDEVHDDEDPAMTVRGAVMRFEPNSLGQSITHNYLPNPHNIVMSTGHERIDLP
jgi:hypothetical protein